MGLEQKEFSHLFYVYGSITEDNDYDVADINSVINYILGEIKSPLEKTGPEEEYWGQMSQTKK